MRTILAAVALATALHAATASAQESRQQTEDRERRFRELDGFRRGSTSSAKSSANASSPVHGYQGMYFRPEVGFGYMSVKMDSGKASGPSGSFGLHLGGALAPDVLIGVHFYEVVMANPSTSGSVADLGTSNMAVAAAAIGPELTFGLPADFYWSATVAATRLGIAVDTATGTVSDNTKIGVGAKLALGFDHWFPSGKWALGAAVHASYSRNQYDVFEGVTTMLNTWSGGASFSVTWD